MERRLKDSGFNSPSSMIVNYTAEGWQVITQRAHGIVAAQLAAQWKLSERPARWTETILAIAEHDDAEVELDGESLLASTGGPLNFDMKVFDAGHCRRLAMLSQTKSRYIALLTSLHMEFLYRKDAGSIPEAKAFLTEQKKLRAAWQKELDLGEKETERCYNLLEWADACSLLLCRNALQPERRKLEISTGPNGQMHHLVQVDEKTVTVEPWPFAEKTFTVNFEWRAIAQLQFASSAEFREAFLAASVQETVWIFAKQKVAPKRQKVNGQKAD